MKSPNVQNNSITDATQITARQNQTTFPTRRITDITPASSKIKKSDGAPTSPKIHELIERGKQ